jgi:hypothetical protein
MNAAASRLVHRTLHFFDWTQAMTQAPTRLLRGWAMEKGAVVNPHPFSFYLSIISILLTCPDTFSGFIFRGNSLGYAENLLQGA